MWNNAAEMDAAAALAAEERSHIIVTSADEDDESDDDNDPPSHKEEEKTMDQTSTPTNGQQNEATRPRDEKEDDDDTEDDDSFSGNDAPDSHDLYDDQADQRDERYVNQHFRHAASGEDDAAVNVSDASLSCPCCFALLCLDCQQHDRYTNQFRAMFVLDDHLTILDNERWVHAPAGTSDVGLVRTKSDVATTNSAPSSAQPWSATSSSTDVIPPFAFDDDEEEISTDGAAMSATTTEYQTVQCALCHTQVAVLDPVEQVYHFTNCLASSS
jgi:hypothetical protein